VREQKREHARAADLDGAARDGGPALRRRSGRARLALRARISENSPAFIAIERRGFASSPSAEHDVQARELWARANRGRPAAAIVALAQTRRQCERCIMLLLLGFLGEERQNLGGRLGANDETCRLTGSQSRP